MNIVFVGAGRLATNFSLALHAKGHCIQAVYSRTMQSAQALAEVVGAQATDHVQQLPVDADAYILALKDSVLTQVIPSLAKGRENCMFFHTAGSIPISVFDGLVSNYGVIYPMQTFSKERLVDFSHIPVFIEGNDNCSLALARQIASSVSSEVHELSGEARRHLHLAAVFACNFANHCYTLSASILQQHGLPFSVMLPLINETARKVATMHPKDAQTGPAVRYDENVINAQLAMLAHDPMAHDIYDLMSKSIHEYSKNDD